MGSLLKVVGLWGSRGYTNNKGYYCCPQCILDLEGNNLLLAIPQNSETGLGRIGWELEASSLRASSYTIYQKMLCKLLREKSSQKPYQTVNPTYYNNYQPGKISLIAQQCHLYLGSKQQLSNCTYGLLNRREFMPYYVIYQVCIFSY